MGPSLVCVSATFGTYIVTIVHILVQCNYLCKLCTILSSYLRAKLKMLNKIKINKIAIRCPGPGC